MSDPPEEQPSSVWAQPASPPPPVPPPPGAQPGGSAWNPPPPVPAAPGYYQQKTNSTAIISLIFGIAQFVVCPIVGAIVAIVTGHIARGQIARSNGAEGGRGLATAGTILGYVGLALTVLAIAGAIVFFAVFADDVERAALRSEARDFVDRAQEEATLSGNDVRDPEVLQRAYVQHRDDDYGEMTLADGTPILGASVDDWERNRWRIALDGDFGADVCAQVPTEVFEDPVVTNGECDPSG